MSLALAALLMHAAWAAPERGAISTRTSTSIGTADPAAEDEEHRPVEPVEPGTNERLIADIRATTGEVTLPEIVDEILSDVVAELAGRPAKVFSPMAIRTVILGQRVDPSYEARLLSALIVAVHAGTDIRMVECIECQATKTEVNGDRLVVTRGVASTEQSRQIGRSIGAKSFVDLTFNFDPKDGVVELGIKVVRAEDSVVLWADTFTADQTTPMLLRSSFAPQKRKDRLRDLEMLLEGRPLYGYAASAGFMLLPYDDPASGDIAGATAGYRIYERFGVDRQVLFGLDAMGFLNTTRLTGGLLSAGTWWVFPRPDLIHPEFRFGGKAGAFVAGSKGNAAVFQLGGEVLLRYRFGVYAYILFMTKSELETGKFLGGVGAAAGMSFNW
ncbi:MAG: hypothetical protein U1E65_14805 [Myxococcota bacterium]